MTPIANSGSFWVQFRVSRDLFNDLTAGGHGFELSYRGYLQQPVEFKIVRTENNYVSNEVAYYFSGFYSYVRVTSTAPV